MELFFVSQLGYHPSFHKLTILYIKDDIFLVTLKCHFKICSYVTDS